MHSHYEYEEKDIIDSHISFLYKVADKGCELLTIRNTMEGAYMLDFCTNDKTGWHDEKDFCDEDPGGKDLDKKLVTSHVASSGQESLLGEYGIHHRRYHLWKNGTVLRRLAQISRKIPWIRKGRHSKSCSRRARDEALIPTLHYVTYPMQQERIDLMETHDSSLYHDDGKGFTRYFLAKSNNEPVMMLENAASLS